MLTGTKIGVIDVLLRLERRGLSSKGPNQGSHLVEKRSYIVLVYPNSSLQNKVSFVIPNPGQAPHHCYAVRADRLNGRQRVRNKRDRYG
jgi:hypothetical protein